MQHLSKRKGLQGRKLKKKSKPEEDFNCIASRTLDIPAIVKLNYSLSCLWVMFHKGLYLNVSQR